MTELGKIGVDFSQTWIKLIWCFRIIFSVWADRILLAFSVVNSGPNSPIRTIEFVHLWPSFRLFWLVLFEFSPDFDLTGDSISHWSHLKRQALKMDDFRDVAKLSGFEFIFELHFSKALRIGVELSKFSNFGSAWSPGTNIEYSVLIQKHESSSFQKLFRIKFSKLPYKLHGKIVVVGSCRLLLGTLG